MVTAVKLVLAALMFGENVLLHCRQGKHHSGAFCVLMSALLLGSSIEAAVDIYMSKRRDLHGHDRRIVEKLVRKKGLNAFLEKLRRQEWCQCALQNILIRVWAHSMRNVPQPKSMPSSSRQGTRAVQPKAMPRSAQQDTTASSVQEHPRAIIAPRAASSSQRSTSSVQPPWRRSSRSPRRSSSSSSAWTRIQVCRSCGRMPWLCKCCPEQREQLLAAFFPHSASTEGTQSDAEVDTELFKAISRRAGVWLDVEDAQHVASHQRDLSRSPSPEPEDKEAWPCVQCSNLNSRHVIYCTVATCGARRPLVQRWRSGDFYCPSCGNHRYASSYFCQWVHCHTNDWKCPQCKNVNYGARKHCHTRWCQHPRDWRCQRCGRLNYTMRKDCKDCQHRKP